VTVDEAPVIVPRTPTSIAATATASTTATATADSVRTMVTAESPTYDDERAESRETDTLAPDVPGVHRPGPPPPPPTVVHVIDGRTGADALVQTPVADARSTTHAPPPTKAVTPLPGWWDRARETIAAATGARR
jgi:hypothetical protein